MRDDDYVVKLNIGGRKFETTFSTLRYDMEGKHKNLFSAMLGVNEDIISPYKLDSEGYIFFDRNGDLFHYILAILRSGYDLSILPWSDSVLMKNIYNELMYFGFDTIANNIKYHLGLEGYSFTLDLSHQGLILSDPISHDQYLSITKQNAKRWEAAACVNPLNRYGSVIKTNKSAKHFNYLEIIIIEPGFMMLGITKQDNSCIKTQQRVPGFQKESLSWNIRNLKRHLEGKTLEVEYGEICTKNDRVGIWYDCVKHTVHYYKNGKDLGEAFGPNEINLFNLVSGNHPEDDFNCQYYFCLSFYSKNIKIKILRGQPHPDLINS